MSHHVYNTRGFILSSRPLREADKLFFILTPDLGLIHATARGVRKESSKLRAILQDLALVDVSLVRGKHDWRLTTSALIQDNAQILSNDKPKLVALARIASLLERLMHGEEKHEGLYGDVESAVTKLNSPTENIDPSTWEIFMVSHLLFHLGYLAEEHLPKNIDEASMHKKELVRAINEGLQESHLTNS